MQAFKTSKAKESILRKIRSAIQDEPLPIPYPEVENKKLRTVFQDLAMSNVEESFAYEFTNSGGHFIYCQDRAEALKNFQLLAESRNWQEVLCAPKSLFSYLIHKKLSFIREFNPDNKTASACITDCEAAIARTGSVLLSSRQNHGRVSPVYYPVHILVVTPNQLVHDIEDGLEFIRKKYNGQLPSMVSLTTGPSRTADIEKTLVTGVHGPREVFCFFIHR